MSRLTGLSTASAPKHPYIADCFRPAVLDPEDIAAMTPDELAKRKATEVEAESVVRLAASAPDLLEALQSLLKVVERTPQAREGFNTIAVERSREAIRKAIG